MLLLSFPPLDICRLLQPLQRTIYEPFKESIKKSIDNWRKKYRTKPLSILDIPGFVEEAYATSVTESNITAGFRSTKIWPNLD